MAVLVPAGLVSGAVLTGVAQGAIGVSLATAGQITLTVDRVESEGFEIMPSVSTSGTAALVVRLPSAEVSGLCQTSTVDLPVIGAMTTELRARQVHVTDLVLEVHDLGGALSLDELLVGRGADPDGGRVGHRAGKAVLGRMTIKAESVTARSFAAEGLQLGHRDGTQGCSGSPSGDGR
ncbi:hypothetical protein IOD16_14625 [Saccharothrix sp. 6-C]|uniref:DUF6230 family protein n=1 Tax=Saccharothrix TaxID=2071 RepID=UPI000F4C73B4|nr:MULTISPECIES: DUF6230 family protein [Saccharothrix]QQQ79521.1 hypothetical protein IOD16_14625 [Saccharothrix sp. 6-C]